MKILGIIPARGGSKGIPKKNIKLLKGKPLIAYTIESALNSKLDRLIVSTDDQEILDIAKKYNVNVLTRPSHLAEDKTPTLSVIQDIILKIDEKFDALMVLQPTSPLRKVEDINKSIDLFKHDENADSLVSVVKVSHNYMPQKLMSLEGKYLKGGSEIKRRQEMPDMYARNGAAIYITRISNIKNNLLGNKILPYIMSKSASFDIDDHEDWQIIEKFI